MPRDSGGNYTSPSSSFVTGTTISSAVMNGKLDDLGSEITNSLSRNGDGGMLARWRGVDGSAAAPAYSFTAETDVGFYRAGSGDIRFVDGAANLLKVATAEVRVYPAFVTEGTATIGTGLTVTAGGATITAGGLTVTAGGSSMSGALGTNATVASAHTAVSSGTMANTSGNTYPLHNVRGTTTGANLISLTTRARNTGTVTDWQNVDVGLSYDVDLTVGSGGSFYLGKNGATINGGTAATAADPTNALTLSNGNLKLSGTAPNKDEAIANTLTPANICKAWAYFTVLGGNGSGNFTPTFADGQGITSIARQDASTIRVTFATAFSSTSYSPRIDTEEVSTTKAVIKAGRTTTTVDIEIQTVSTGVAVNLDAAASQWALDLAVHGRQA